MLDEFAIQQVLSTYSEASSRGDEDLVMSTFVEDGIWEIPILEKIYRGKAAVRAVMAAIRGQMAYIIQSNAPAIIKVDGDKATSRCVVHETGKLADRDESLEILGFYHDDLVRTADGWKFTHRKFVLAGMHNFAVKPIVLPA